MGSIACFWIEPTDWNRRFLRRYRGGISSKCSVGSYHDARVEIERGPVMIGRDGHPQIEEMPEGDVRWPRRCQCGYEFTDLDEHQLFVERVYRRTDTGAELTLREAPVGAMWNAWWYPWRGNDGRSIIVRTPGGDWCIDSRASNCDMPKDREHRCWVRHGTPPKLTVDKNGFTCGAGGGSIAMGGYHGFLRNGRLERC